jgi:tol-pal system protein YbgF
MKKAVLFFSLLAIYALNAADSYAQNYSTGSYLGADVARLEQEVRELRGQNERLRHELTQVKEAQRRFQEDMEFRLNGGPGGSPVPPPPPGGNASIPPVPSMPPVAPPPASPAFGQPVTASTPFGTTAPLGDGNVITVPNAPAPTTLEDRQTLRLPVQGQKTPRELYNEAFRMLNQTDYDGAERAFARFINDYPTDPLIGNAWYWMGETFYVRREYVRAADAFRQGFEAMEEGPKAGDNLLKLAMSLAAMEKDQEACVVLKQVDGKYAKNSEGLASKTKQEINRLGC